MVKKDSKFALSMTYGPREESLLRDIEKISKNQEFYVSRNEVLRRGLYAFRNLVDVDETVQLKLLSYTLHLLKENIDLDTLRFAKDTASQILTILIIKYGLAKADSFETVLDSLETIYGVLNTQKLDKKYDEEIKKEISDLATSLDTVFLNQEKNSQKISSVLHFLQLQHLTKSESEKQPKTKSKFTVDLSEFHDLVKDSRDMINTSSLYGKPVEGVILWANAKKNLGILEANPNHHFLITPINPSDLQPGGVFDLMSSFSPASGSRVVHNSINQQDFENNISTSEDY